MTSLRSLAPAALALAAVLAACSSEAPSGGAPASASVSAAAASAPARPRAAPSTEGAATRNGSALARTPDKALVLADEDHGVVRHTPRPVDTHGARDAIAMPGPPAQLVALADRVLVTVREPGLLVELVEDLGY